MKFHNISDEQAIHLLMLINSGNKKHLSATYFKKFKVKITLLSSIEKLYSYNLYCLFY